MKYLKKFESVVVDPYQKVEDFLDDTFAEFLDNWGFETLRKNNDSPIQDAFYFFMKSPLSRSVSLHINIRRELTRNSNYGSIVDDIVKLYNRVKEVYPGTLIRSDVGAYYYFAAITIQLN